MIGLLLVVALQSDRVDELVRQLDADDAAVRDAAQVELLEMGAEIAPLLLARLAGASAEVSARLRMILDRFELQARLDATLPRVRRITLAREPRTAAELLSRLRELSGYRIPVYGVDLSPRVELGWDDAPVLQALDDFCAAVGGATLEVPVGKFAVTGQRIERKGELRIEAGTERPAAVAYWDQFRATVNDVVITETRKFAGATEKAVVQASIQAQPGTKPIWDGGWIVDVVEDDQGRSLRLAAAAARRGEFPDPDIGENRSVVWFSGESRWSASSMMGPVAFEPPAPEAKRIARLVLRRRFAFSLGEETRTIKLSEFEPGAVLRFGDVAVTINRAEWEQNGFTVDYSTTGPFRGTPDIVLLDPSGRHVISGGSSSSGSGARVERTSYLDRATEIDALSVSADVGVFAIEATFEFGDVSLPERP